MKALFSILAVALLVTASGCAFYEQKNAATTESIGAVDGPLEPNFISIRDHVFQSKCLRCHKESGSASDYPLSTYDAMMAVDGLVVVGNPDASSLVGAIVNGSMPPVRSQLPAVTAEELQVIRQWITDGAIIAPKE